jgi:8-oxo-dGTP diphosphatase
MTVVRGIIKFGDRYLVMRRTPYAKYSPGKWEFPAGKAKEGEPEEEAFGREMMEETGQVFVVRGSFETTVIGKYDTYRQVCYICDAESDRVEMSGEHTEFKWSEMKEIVGMDISDSTELTMSEMKKEPG